MRATTELTFTIRPQRALIIERNTDLHRRKVPARFVSITSLHSSSFMRTSKLSCVIPALLMRTETSPQRSEIRWTEASTNAGSSTRIIKPIPRSPSHPSMFSTPLSVVDVPTTKKPSSTRRSAMLFPIPRLAPVTSAVRSILIRFPRALLTDRQRYR